MSLFALGLVGVTYSQATLSQSNVQPAIEEMIIVGEKTERTLQNTASSVIALSSDQLRQLGLTSSTDLLDRIPNLVTVEPGNEAPAIRGVDGTGPAAGANAFFAGTRSRLNIQVDGRTLGFNEAVFQNASLWDSAQVEVYRGPQSTLQGRNSIAGNIAIVTQDPSFDWEGKVRGIVGEQDSRTGSFVLSGPLLDEKLAFRLAGDYQEHETAVSFTPYAEEDDPSSYRTETYRAKLLYTPGEDVRSLLTIGRNDGRSPQSERVIRPFSDRQAEFPNQPTFRSRNDYGIWDLSWRINDSVLPSLNLSTTDFFTERHALTGQGNLTIDGNEWVVQPMLRLGQPRAGLSGFVSLYLFRSNQDEAIDLFGGGEFRDETNNNSILGEMTWDLSRDVTLTLGARYEEEERYRAGGAGPLLIDFEDTYREFLPKATLTWQANDNWTLGVTSGRGYNGGGAGITFNAPFTDYSYEPEYVMNYEGFVRGRLFDGALAVTANLFFNDYKDMQLPFSLSSNSTVIRNADRATTYGLEGGATFTLKNNSELFINIGLLETNVDKYADDTVEGKDLARAPAFSADIGMTLFPTSRLELTANLHYSDAYYSDATNTTRGKVDPYAIVNSQLAFNLDRARLFINVKNLFDSDAEVSILTGATADADSATLLQPRQLTAGVEYRF